ncbi:hypothetical protein [Marinobacter zhejiangensis]|uniref:Uncharacterized protein n=1 Tax=Marinobacter zhejiangensis TaxID=488535 RepID=A0A1I4TLT7_9GAMM|nr:hypothetical protein [Marinobacter zhejiangensis]SFM77646.1 hypothetical protein SAMN04487963_3657 [Marinobacter zhejiangensis]
MGFLKTLAKVFLANVLIIALAVVLYVAFVGRVEVKLVQQPGSERPAVVVTFGEINERLAPAIQVTQQQNVSLVASSTAQSSQTQPRQLSSTRSSDGASASAIRSSAHMCQFWARMYANDQETQSRIHRESACSRYELLSGNSRTAIVSRSVLNGADTSVQRQQFLQRQTLAERRQNLAEQLREQRELQARCDSYNEQLDDIQAELRSGYSVSRGNHLRSLRREVSEKYSRECILGR